MTGQTAPSGTSIEFKDRCGLKMRGEQHEHRPCVHYPFGKSFDYTACALYLETFKAAGQRNDVIPTSDILYSDKLSANSITEMELL